MAKKLTQFQEQRLMRKNRSIYDLANQYKSNVNALTGEYEKSFSEYTAKRNEAMKPYEAAMQTYTANTAAYEQSAAAYKQKLADYQKRLQDSIDNPQWDRVDYAYVDKPGTGGSTKWLQTAYGNFGWDNLPSGFRQSQETRYGPPTLYKIRQVGAFTDKAPTAPEAPTAPVVEEFDKQPFEQKKAELEGNYKREIGERRAAKTNAVSRKQARPLLQGA